MESTNGRGNSSPTSKSSPSEEQNVDGSWGPYFLAARSAGADPVLQLRSTGRMLGMVGHLAAREAAGRRPRRERSEVVANLLGSQRYQGVHVVAFHARDRGGGATPCTPSRLRRAGLQTSRRGREAGRGNPVHRRPPPRYAAQLARRHSEHGEDRQVSFPCGGGVILCGHKENSRELTQVTLPSVSFA